MKRTIALAAASLFAPAVFVAPAFAGGADISAQADVDAGTTASTSAQKDIASAISALQSSTAASMIRSMSKVSTIHVVSLSKEETATTDIEPVIEQNQDKIQDLRAAIASNQAVMSKLKAKQVEVANVIAARTNADGTLTVYTR